MSKMNMFHSFRKERDLKMEKIKNRTINSHFQYSSWLDFLFNLSVSFLFPLHNPLMQCRECDIYWKNGNSFGKYYFVELPSCLRGFGDMNKIRDFRTRRKGLKSRTNFISNCSTRTCNVKNHQFFPFIVFFYYSYQIGFIQILPCNLDCFNQVSLWNKIVRTGWERRRRRRRRKERNKQDVKKFIKVRTLNVRTRMLKLNIITNPDLFCSLNLVRELKNFSPCTFIFLPSDSSFVFRSFISFSFISFALGSWFFYPSFWR